MFPQFIMENLSWICLVSVLLAFFALSFILVRADKKCEISKRCEEVRNNGNYGRVNNYDE